MSSSLTHPHYERLDVSPEYHKRYLEDLDRRQLIAERCGAPHLSNVGRILAEFGIYRTPRP